MCLSVELKKYAEIPKQKHQAKTPPLRYRFTVSVSRVKDGKRSVSHPIAVFQRLHRHDTHACNGSNYKVLSYFSA